MSEQISYPAGEFFTETEYVCGSTIFAPDFNHQGEPEHDE